MVLAAQITEMFSGNGDEIILTDTLKKYCIFESEETVLINIACIFCCFSSWQRTEFLTLDPVLLSLS